MFLIDNKEPEYKAITLETLSILFGDGTEAEAEESAEKPKGNPAWRKKKQSGTVDAKFRHFYKYESMLENWIEKERDKFQKRYYNAGSHKYSDGGVRIKYPASYDKPDKANPGKRVKPKLKGLAITEKFLFKGDDEIKGDNRVHTISYYDNLLIVEGKKNPQPQLEDGTRSFHFRGDKTFGELEKDLCFFLLTFSTKKGIFFEVEDRAQSNREIAEQRRKVNEIYQIIYRDLDNSDDLRMVAKANNILGVDSMTTDDEVRVALDNKANVNDKSRTDFINNSRISEQVTLKALIREGLDRKIIGCNVGLLPQRREWHFFANGQMDRIITEQKIFSQPQEEFLFEWLMSVDKDADTLKELLKY